MLLNSDAFVRPGVVGLLGDALRRTAGLAAVGPSSTSRRDLMQYRRTPRGEYGGMPGVTPTPFLTAMCLMLRRAAVGERPFDPVYAPGYFEDLDLCCRLRDEGWELGIVEGARVHHVGGATTGRDASRGATMARNFATFSARWHSRPEQESLEAFLRAVDAPCDGSVP